MEWIKRNGALALGVGLPLLLVGFFALASWLPTVFVAPPQYDVLFMTNEGSGQMKYTVENQRLVFTYVGQNFESRGPKLYRYSPKTGGVQKIDIPIPEGLEQREFDNKLVVSDEERNRITPLPVPALESVKVDTNVMSPDGYQFRNVTPRDSGGLIGALFFSPRYNYNLALEKNGNIVTIPNPEATQSYYYPVVFVGWVIP